jgi:hypothetical protein
MNKINFILIRSVSLIAVSIIFFCLNLKEMAVADAIRMEKDLSGKEWELRDWAGGSRPYPKNLQEREKWYRQKWGESWYGIKQNVHLFSPGIWKWETIDTVPSDMAVRIQGRTDIIWGNNTKWGTRYNITNFLWAPGSGQVTDFYALSDNAFYHFDPVTKKRIFIGKPEEGGLVDGKGEDARLYPRSGAATLDNITGRLYFIQDQLNAASPLIDAKFRYVEKLLPYKDVNSDKTYYLPAVLDWNDLYKRVKGPSGEDIVPVMNGDVRADPVFDVKTNSNIKNQTGFMDLSLQGANKGKRILITPDGKGVWLSQNTVGTTQTPWDTKMLYDSTALFDIKSGKLIKLLSLQGNVLLNNWDTINKKYWDSAGPGTHGGNNIGYDGNIYTAQHPGCCGPTGRGQGRMFSIDTTTGELTMLYNSMSEDDTEWTMWEYRSALLIDGPADAKSLSFTSTLYQIQCPRTGAILNGGWDNSGIRRYHDGFVTTLISGGEFIFYSPRPDWIKKESPSWWHRNSNPAVAPDGSLYIADVNYKEPRVIRIYRTDWTAEQPVNGYAEKFMPKDKVEALMIEYAKKYIEAYAEQTKNLKHN